MCPYKSIVKQKWLHTPLFAAGLLSLLLSFNFFVVYQQFYFIPNALIHFRSCSWCCFSENRSISKKKDWILRKRIGCADVALNGTLNIINNSHFETHCRFCWPHKQKLTFTNQTSAKLNLKVSIFNRRTCSLRKQNNWADFVYHLLIGRMRIQNDR